MHTARVYLGFLPWVVFSLLASRAGANSVAWASILALITALVIAASSLRHGSVKIIEGAAIVIFAVLTVVGFIGGSPVDAWLATYARPVATLLFAMIILALLPIMPFTEQYAREQVPEQFWHSPRFRRANTVLSAAWAAALIAMAASHGLAGWLGSTAKDSGGTHHADLWLNWVVPLLILYAVVKFTQIRAGAAPSASYGHTESPVS